MIILNPPCSGGPVDTSKIQYAWEIYEEYVLNPDYPVSLPGVALFNSALRVLTFDASTNQTSSRTVSGVAVSLISANYSYFDSATGSSKTATAAIRVDYEKIDFTPYLYNITATTDCSCTASAASAVLTYRIEFTNNNIIPINFVDYGIVVDTVTKVPGSLIVSTYILNN